MAQENKEILLKVLSEQFSYGVLILDTAAEKYGKLYQINSDSVWYDCQETGEVECQTIFNVKPYLRPMSSMTEGDIHSLFNAMYPDISMMWYEKETDLIRFRAADYNNKRFLHITLWFNKIYSLKQIDWLNKYHFDYRGLIPMGLALEAKEGMYKTE